MGLWSKQEALEPGEPPGRRRRPARGAIVTPAVEGDVWILDRCEGKRRDQAVEGKPQSGIRRGGQDGLLRWGQAIEWIAEVERRERIALGVGPARPMVGNDSASHIGRRGLDPSHPRPGGFRRAQGKAGVENNQGQECSNPTHEPILPAALRVEQGVSLVSKSRGKEESRPLSSATRRGFSPRTSRPFFSTSTPGWAKSRGDDLDPRCDVVRCQPQLAIIARFYTSNTCAFLKNDRETRGTEVYTRRERANRDLAPPASPAGP